MPLDTWANQASDRAANKIAAVLEQRNPNTAEQATLAKYGWIFTDDIKTVIIEKRSQEPTTRPTNARKKERAPTTQYSKEGDGRRLMKYAAKRYKNGGILKRVLNYCGNMTHSAPLLWYRHRRRKSRPSRPRNLEMHSQIRNRCLDKPWSQNNRQLREGPLRKMNEKVHRQTDGEIMYNTEWTTTPQLESRPHSRTKTTLKKYITKTQP